MSFALTIDQTRYWVCDFFAHSFTSSTGENVFAGLNPLAYAEYLGWFETEPNILVSARYEAPVGTRYFLVRQNGTGLTDYRARSYQDGLHYIVLETQNLVELTDTAGRVRKLQLLCE